MTAILVKFEEGSTLREREDDVARFEALVATLGGLKWTRCFDGDVDLLRQRLVRANLRRPNPIPSPDLFLHVQFPDTENPDGLIDALGQDPAIESAVRASATLSQDPAIEDDVRTLATKEPSTTPDLSSLQLYLGSSGVNANMAWALHGGAGSGVRACVCEEGFTVNHEDLPSVIVVSNLDGELGSDQFHGARTLGVLFARRDARGVTGICHDATPLFASTSGPPNSPNNILAIHEACDHLEKGDVLILEMEIAGLGAPAEWAPEIHAACALAADRGIIVVAAAGNDDHNLDKLTNRSGRFIWDAASSDHDDSEAIIVGAGSPPGIQFPANSYLTGGHGRRVDCHGWGRLVATTGGGGDQIIPNREPKRAYTSNYFGTSSATAMVAGVVVCVQGIFKSRFGLPMAPGMMRSLLSDASNGRPQVDRDGHETCEFPIGPLPDLGKLIKAIDA